MMWMLSASSRCRWVSAPLTASALWQPGPECDENHRLLKVGAVRRVVSAVTEAVRRPAGAASGRNRSWRPPGCLDSSAWPGSPRGCASGRRWRERSGCGRAGRASAARGRRRPRRGSASARSRSNRRAVAGHHPVGLFDQTAQPLQRRPVGVDRPAGREHRDLDRRQVVAAHQHRQPRASSRRRRRRCGRRPACSSSSCSGRARAGRAPAATAARRAQRAAVHDRRSARSSKSRSSRCAAPGSAASRAAVLSAHPSGRSGNAEPPEQVVPVPVRGQQPGDGEAACSSTSGSARAPRGRPASRSGSPPRRRARPCRSSARRRLTNTITSACSATARISPASARTGRSADAEQLRRLAQVATSASGFFWPGSSCCLLRLTQITGIFFFRHGSTSW